MKSMKRFIFAGIVVILAAFFVTCEAELPVTAAEEDLLDYEVSVSEGGEAQVTVYLDGAKAPRSASRAMQSPLAQMYFDYFEVLFVGNGTIARTAWELGFPAGISGVSRTGGVDYTAVSGTTYASMFVGKKEGKTLLGVGKITSRVDISTSGVSTTVTGTTVGAITSATDSVTFTISPVLTGLIAPGVTGDLGAEGASSTTVPLVGQFRGVLAESFKYIGGSAGYTTAAGHCSLVKYGPVEYPMYSLSKTANETVTATYSFFFYGNGSTVTQALVLPAIKHYVSTTVKPEVKKRTPRFMDGGAYREPRSFVDTKSTVEFTGTTYSSGLTHGTPFINVVPLTFTTKGSGIFSFYIQIPVYMNDDDTATNSGGTAAERWYIRTGLGSELYSIDDGATAGGCVLMGVGIDSGDWLKIEWDWL